jgi:hypothetical protein
VDGQSPYQLLLQQTVNDEDPAVRTTAQGSLNTRALRKISEPLCLSSINLVLTSERKFNMKTLAYGLTLLMLMACFSSSALTQNKSAQNSKTASAKSALEYLEDGSALYMKREFENAIKPYQKALDLEKQEPTLEKTLWRVLVVPMRK